MSANDEKNSKKSYILKDINIDSCGENIHVIVGPSGSGKTTLLRLLNKLEVPDSGNIFLDGIDISTMDSRKLRKKVGMVFQVPALFDATIADNILFGPRIFNVSEETIHVEKYLALVGLNNIEPERHVNKLSVGQQQRVSFARALANEPEILLLDEPTSALDPTAANNLLDIIRRIYEQLGVGIVFVTHVMQHAERIADTACLIVEGKIIEHGKAKDFFKKPQTLIGQQFLRGELN